MGIIMQSAKFKQCVEPLGLGMDDETINYVGLICLFKSNNVSLRSSTF